MRFTENTPSHCSLCKPLLYNRPCARCWICRKRKLNLEDYIWSREIRVYKFPCSIFHYLQCSIPQILMWLFSFLYSDLTWDRCHLLSQTFLDLYNQLYSPSPPPPPNHSLSLYSFYFLCVTNWIILFNIFLFWGFIFCFFFFVLHLCLFFPTRMSAPWGQGLDYACCYIADKVGGKERWSREGIVGEE